MKKLLILAIIIILFSGSLGYYLPYLRTHGSNCHENLSEIKNPFNTSLEPRAYVDKVRRNFSPKSLKSYLNKLKREYLHCSNRELFIYYMDKHPSIHSTKFLSSRNVSYYCENCLGESFSGAINMFSY